MCFASLPCEAREPHERIVRRTYIRIVSSVFSIGSQSKRVWQHGIWYLHKTAYTQFALERTDGF